MEDFLKQLSIALSGEIPEEEVEKNIKYYTNYFYIERGKGRSEDDILEELGDPNLIARSIIDADKISGRASYNFNNDYSENQYKKNYESATYNDKSSYSYNSRHREDYDNRNGRSRKFYSNENRDHGRSYSCGGGCLKAILIVFFVVLLLLAIISTIFKGIFSIFKFAIFGGAPVILILLIVLIVLIFRNRR